LKFITFFAFTLSVIKMRILITGGAGFVGSNLALALQANVPSAEVVCMDNLYRRGSELNLFRACKRPVFNFIAAMSVKPMAFRRAV
jgi:nucleoside-diphosphate-sugar epimerase